MNLKLVNLPQIPFPSNNTVFYMVDGGISYQGTLSQLSSIVLNNISMILSGIPNIDGGTFFDIYLTIANVDGGGFGDTFLLANVDGGNF